MPEHDRPDRQDLVLGGSLPPPIDSLVLGGIAGLRQRFTTATPDRKIQLLIQSINYDRAGIDLSIAALHDPDLTVRIAAYELLIEIDTNEAKEAISLGIPVNPGDRIYRVYESTTAYNDSWIYLMDSLAKRQYWDSEPNLLGSYLSEERAVSIAQNHHKQSACQRYVELSYIGREEYFRGDFDIQSWATDNRIFERHSEQTIVDFAEKLRKMLEYIEAKDLVSQLSQKFQSSTFDIDAWAEIELQNFLSRHPENYREWWVVQMLKSFDRDDMIAQLWLEVAGKLAFVEEEIVTEADYFNPRENP